MVRHDGFEVKLVVDKKELVEYIDNNKIISATTAGTTPCIERYVEAQTGREFSFHYRALDKRIQESGYVGIVIDPMIDGSRIGGKQHKQEWPYAGELMHARYCTNGVRYKQRFIFGELGLSDVPNADKDVQARLKKKGPNMGTLEIKIYRATSFTRSAGKDNDFGNHAAEEEDIIDEKLLKGRAVSHQTTFGPARPSARNIYGTTIHIKYADAGPYLHFKFHYMDKASLEIMGLIPRTNIVQQIRAAARIPRDFTRKRDWEQAMEEANAQIESEMSRRGGLIGSSVKLSGPFEAQGRPLISIPKAIPRKAPRITIDLTED